MAIGESTTSPLGLGIPGESRDHSITCDVFRVLASPTPDVKSACSPSLKTAESRPEWEVGDCSHKPSIYHPLLHRSERITADRHLDIGPQHKLFDHLRPLRRLISGTSRPSQQSGTCLAPRSQRSASSAHRSNQGSDAQQKICGHSRHCQPEARHGIIHAKQPAVATSARTSAQCCRVERAIVDISEATWMHLETRESGPSQRPQCQESTACEWKLTNTTCRADTRRPQSESGIPAWSSGRCNRVNVVEALPVPGLAEYVWNGIGAPLRQSADHPVPRLLRYSAVQRDHVRIQLAPRHTDGRAQRPQPPNRLSENRRHRGSEPSRAHSSADRCPMMTWREADVAAAAGNRRSRGTQSD